MGAEAVRRQCLAPMKWCVSPLLTLPLALVTAHLCGSFCSSLGYPQVLIFLKVDLSIPARLLLSQPDTFSGSAGSSPLLHSGKYVIIWKGPSTYSKLLLEGIVVPVA